jgi:hypothetical protein
MRRAHIHFKRGPAFLSMRKGEPKTSLGLTSSAFQRNAEGPELPHATRMPGDTMPAGYPLLFNPRFHPNQCAQSIQGGLRCSNPRFRLSSQSNTKPPGGRLMGIRSRGLGEKICARQTCPYEGQTAAHFQITERKPSVAHLRFSFISHEGGAQGSRMNDSCCREWFPAPHTRLNAAFPPGGRTENSPGSSAAEPWGCIQTRISRPGGSRRRRSLALNLIHAIALQRGTISAALAFHRLHRFSLRADLDTRYTAAHSFSYKLQSPPA